MSQPLLTSEQPSVSSVRHDYTVTWGKSRATINATDPKSAAYILARARFSGVHITSEIREIVAKAPAMEVSRPGQMGRYRVHLGGWLGDTVSARNLTLTPDARKGGSR